MAKSFHTIIDDGFFEVEHMGDLVSLELPEKWMELKGKTENVEFLRNWIRENNIELAVYQCALQKRIIELRAIARPAIKKFKDKKGFDDYVEKITEKDDWNIDQKNLEVSLKITADEKAQERIDNAKWKPVERPGLGRKEMKKIAEIKAISTAIKPWIIMGKTKIEIKEIYKEAFSEGVLEIAINNAIEEMED